MTDLITRIEQAEGPSAPLFIAAWNVLQSSDTASADWDRYAGIRVTVDEADVHRWIAFRKCLDAEAWTSAAEVLVPEGWNWMAGERNQGKCRAYVENNQPAFVGISATRNPNRKWFEVVAAHPSLALLAAILRAERKDDHGTDA